MHESRLSLIQHNNNHKTNNKKTKKAKGHQPSKEAPGAAFGMSRGSH